MKQSVVTVICENEDATLEQLEGLYQALEMQSFPLWEWLVPQIVIDSLPRLKKDSRVRPSKAEKFSDLAKEVGEFIFFVDVTRLPLATALEHYVWFLKAHHRCSFVRGQKNEDVLKFKNSEIIADPDYFPIPYLCKADSLARNMEKTHIDFDELPTHLRHWVLQLTATSSGEAAWFIPRILEKNIHKNFESSDVYDDNQARQDILRLTEESCPDMRLYARASQWKPRHTGFTAARLNDPYYWKTPFARAYKHIVCLVPHFTMGGSDKFALDLCSRLKKEKNWRLSFISTLGKDNKWLERFEEISEEVFCLPQLLTLPDYPRFITTIIETRRPDVILITHSAFSYQLLPILKNRFPKIPIVDYLHIVENFWRNGGYPSLSAQYSNFIDKSFVSSKQLHKWMTEYRRLPKNKVQILRTNVDVEEWSPTKYQKSQVLKRHNLPEADCYILFAGRLCQQKRPDILAETARILKQRFDSKKAMCLVAGDGPDADSLAETIQGHKLDNIRLLGSLEQEELRALFAISDIFFLPSENEGVSLAIYEAMAMECVIVASAVGGQEELITPETGSLLPWTGNMAEKFANEIEKLCVDKIRLQRMAKAARNRVANNFSLKDTVADFVQSIENMRNLSDTPLLSNEAAQVLADEFIEQNRLARQNYHLTKLMDNSPEIIRSLEDKLENFRHMIARRDKKLADAEENLAQLNQKNNKEAPKKSVKNKEKYAARSGSKAKTQTLSKKLTFFDRFMKK